MSEVLGTILILALTVTLFSSIFFFVSTFPKPATQPASQFQGQLYYSFATKGAHTWTNVSYVTITHLGGPVIYSFNTAIYVVSQAHPQNTTTVYTLASGGLGASNTASWGTGQVWNLSLAGDHLGIPDNITVTVVAGNLVVYRQTLPGTNPTIPPIFDQEGTSPGTPLASSPFSIFVQISDPFLRTTSTQVYLNLTTPGLTCVNPRTGFSWSTTNTTTKLQMAYNSTNGLWFVPSCSTTTSGTYYVTAWVTDTNPIQVQTNSIIFPVAVGSTSSGGGSTLVQVNILTNTSAPVVGQPISVVVDVTNNGATSGTATVSFGPTASFAPSSSSGTVAAGSTVGFQSTYTPPATSGTVLLNSTATIPGVGTGSDSLALTVYPHILLISYNQPGGIALSKSNESSNLASELAAAGFPFKTFVNSCTNGSFPTSVTNQFVSGAVVVVDFGTNSSNSGCPVGPSYTTPTGYAHSASYYIETGVAAGASFWVVGDRAFWPTASLACATATYTTYLQDFGISAGATCVTAKTLSASPADYASVTYTAGSSLLAQGISSPISLNGNVTGTAAALATYLNYQTYTASGGHVGTPFMTVGGLTLGIFYTGTGGAGRGVAIGADPVQFGDAPAGQSWNAIGAAVTYNVMNYLCGLATTSSPTRAGADFGIAGAFLTGTSHSAASTFLVNVRANDASNGILTVLLAVNGVPALYQGNFVTGTVVEAANGGDSWVSLTWQAPSAGTYVFSFVLSSQPADYFTQNNQYNYFVTNLGITFT